MNIAIDGPAGSGKSTVAKRLAKELSFIYVDTGAMYRAMALHCIRKEADVNSEEAVNALLPEIEVSLRYADGEQQVLLNGEDVSGLIRTRQVSAATSVISAYSAVREKLLSLQRDIAAGADVIMDGRDIGTNVLPNAELKVFLTASVETRAKRRYLELKEKGENPDIADIEKEISERDQRDANRSIAPLKQAEDAVLVDTSDMTIDEVVARIRELAG
ncbi:MAG: (d)CMP kinase [Eubacterium sp.]|nr:(d)CMP kinase [Eubacterium sp.]